jgi:hypothetical protein
METRGLKLREIMRKKRVVKKMGMRRSKAEICREVERKKENEQYIEKL